MREPILPRVAKNEPGAASECIARYEGLVWSLVRRFCRKRGSRKRSVVIGPTAGVCDGCLRVCREILDGRAA